METYDPLVAPDPAAWLALEEPERLALVVAYHERMGIKLSTMRAHASTHVIVENQIAEGDQLPVREKARRLVAQGLDRHDVIHAIGSVLINHIWEITKGQVTDADPNQRYFRALERLTVRSWRRFGGAPRRLTAPPPGG